MTHQLTACESISPDPIYFMKKIIILFLLTLLVFTGIGIAPHLLKIDRVRESVAERLGTQLGIPVSTEQIHWRWLPSPHIVLKDTQVITVQVDFVMPAIIVHPQ